MAVNPPNNVDAMFLGNHNVTYTNANNILIEPSVNVARRIKWKSNVFSEYPQAIDIGQGINLDNVKTTVETLRTNINTTNSALQTLFPPAVNRNGEYIPDTGYACTFNKDNVIYDIYKNRKPFKTTVHELRNDIDLTIKNNNQIIEEVAKTKAVSEVKTDIEVDKTKKLNDENRRNEEELIKIKNREEQEQKQALNKIEWTNIENVGKKNAENKRIEYEVEKEIEEDKLKLTNLFDVNNKICKYNLMNKVIDKNDFKVFNEVRDNGFTIVNKPDIFDSDYYIVIEYSRENHIYIVLNHEVFIKYEEYDQRVIAINLFKLKQKYTKVKFIEYILTSRTTVALVNDNREYRVCNSIYNIHDEFKTGGFQLSMVFKNIKGIDLNAYIFKNNLSNPHDPHGSMRRYDEDNMENKARIENPTTKITIGFAENKGRKNQHPGIYYNSFYDVSDYNRVYKYSNNCYKINDVQKDKLLTVDELREYQDNSIILKSTDAAYYIDIRSFMETKKIFRFYACVGLYNENCSGSYDWGWYKCVNGDLEMKMERNAFKYSHRIIHFGNFNITPGLIDELFQLKDCKEVKIPHNRNGDIPIDFNQLEDKKDEEEEISTKTDKTVYDYYRLATIKIKKKINNNNKKQIPKKKLKDKFKKDISEYMDPVNISDELPVHPNYKYHITFSSIIKVTSDYYYTIMDIIMEEFTDPKDKYHDILCFRSEDSNFILDMNYEAMDDLELTKLKIDKKKTYSELANILDTWLSQPNPKNYDKSYDLSEFSKELSGTLVTTMSSNLILYKVNEDFDTMKTEKLTLKLIIPTNLFNDFCLMYRKLDITQDHIKAASNQILAMNSEQGWNLKLDLYKATIIALVVAKYCASCNRVITTDYDENKKLYESNKTKPIKDKIISAIDDTIHNRTKVLNTCDNIVNSDSYKAVMEYMEENTTVFHKIAHAINETFRLIGVKLYLFFLTCIALPFCNIFMPSVYTNLLEYKKDYVKDHEDREQQYVHPISQKLDSIKNYFNKELAPDEVYDTTKGEKKMTKLILSIISGIYYEGEFSKIIRKNISVILLWIGYILFLIFRRYKWYNFSAPTLLEKYSISNIWILIILVIYTITSRMQLHPTKYIKSFFQCLSVVLLILLTASSIMLLPIAEDLLKVLDLQSSLKDFKDSVITYLIVSVILIIIKLLKLKDDNNPILALLHGFFGTFYLNMGVHVRTKNMSDITYKLATYLPQHLTIISMSLKFSKIAFFFMCNPLLQSLFVYCNDGATLLSNIDITYGACTANDIAVIVKWMLNYFEDFNRRDFVSSGLSEKYKFQINKPKNKILRKLHNFIDNNVNNKKIFDCDANFELEYLARKSFAISGIYIDDNKPYKLHRCFNNEIEAIYRQLRVEIRPEEKIMRQFSRFAKLEIRKLFNDNPSIEINVQEYINSMGKKKQEFANANEEYNMGKAVRYNYKMHSKTDEKFFIEYSSTNVKSRNISAQNSICKQLMGPFTDAAMKIIHDNEWCGPGINSNQRCEKFEKWISEIPDCVVLCVDGSSFDSTQHKQILSCTDSYFLTQLLKRSYGWEKDFQYSHVIKVLTQTMFKVFSKNFSYRVFGTQMSGRMNTCLNNTLRSYLYIKFIVSKLGLRYPDRFVKFEVSGDDQIIFMPSWLVDRYIECAYKYVYSKSDFNGTHGLGQIAKIIEVHEEITGAEYLSMYLLYDTISGQVAMVRKPERFLQMTPYTFRNDKKNVFLHIYTNCLLAIADYQNVSERYQLPFFSKYLNKMRDIAIYKLKMIKDSLSFRDRRKCAKVVEQELIDSEYKVRDDTREKDVIRFSEILYELLYKKFGIDINDIDEYFDVINSINVNNYNNKFQANIVDKLNKVTSYHQYRQMYSFIHKRTRDPIITIRNNTIQLQ